MLVWRLNLAWKSGHPNQCLRLGDDAKTDRTLRARFRESASRSRLRFFVVAAGADCGLRHVAAGVSPVRSCSRFPMGSARVAHSPSPTLRRPGRRRLQLKATAPGTTTVNVAP